MTKLTSSSALASLSVASPSALEKDPLLHIISSLASPKQLTVIRDPQEHLGHHNSKVTHLVLSSGVILEERNAILRCLCGMGLHNALDQAPYYLMGGHAAAATSSGSPLASMALAGIASWQSWADQVRTGTSDESKQQETPSSSLWQDLNLYLERRAFLVPSAACTLADLDVALVLLTHPSVGSATWQEVPHVTRWLIQCHATLVTLAGITNLPTTSIPPLPITPPLTAVPIFFDGSEDVTAAALTTATPAGRPANADKKSAAAPSSSEKEKTKDNKGNEDKEANKAEAKPKSPAAEKKKAAATPAAEAPAEFNVSALDIRVGKILKVWPHETADKLFCEEIDLGEPTGPRKIASGLRPFYQAEELQDRTVLVLANLKARTLVGFSSHGMVLCASNDDHTKVELVVPPEGSQIGERVMFEGFDGPPEADSKIAKKKILEKLAPDLKTNAQGQFLWKEAVAKTSGGIIVASMPDAHVS